MTKRTVRLQITLEVDIEAWADEYGIEPTASAVRDDLFSYVKNGLPEATPVPVTVTARSTHRNSSLRS